MSRPSPRTKWTRLHPLEQRKAAEKEMAELEEAHGGAAAFAATRARVLARDRIARDLGDCETFLRAQAPPPPAPPSY
jgi:hypothetical protein